MKYLKLSSQKGDTIIEVMIVLTILSLAFGIAFATASDGLDRSRAAEEHSEALGMLESQVELTRAAFANNQTIATNYSFCFQTPAGSTPTNQIIFTNYTVPQSIVNDNLASPPYPAACTSGSGGFSYYISITYRTPPVGQTWQSYYDYLVRWQGAGNLGLQQEELTYKISTITDDARADDLISIACPQGEVGILHDSCVDSSNTDSSGLLALSRQAYLASFDPNFKIVGI
jgi:prepilin-type N-terminal cleavage/methylation domain-containing protein